MYTSITSGSHHYHGMGHHTCVLLYKPALSPAYKGSAIPDLSSLFIVRTSKQGKYGTVRPSSQTTANTHGYYKPPLSSQLYEYAE
jgi:hypothetical protein